MNPEEVFGRGGLNANVDAAQLTDDIGLDREEIAWRKEFIGFDAEDERRLASMEPLLREHREEIAERFYENLTQYDQTTGVIGRSEKSVEQLKLTQQAYMVTLATGDYDEAYFRNRARIGKLHELLDMPLKHYIGQYGVYYDLLFERLDDRIQDQVVEAIENWAVERAEAERSDGLFGNVLAALGDDDADDPANLDDDFESTVREAIHDGVADLLALLRIINLDVQVACDTYVDSYSNRLEEEIERRERLANDVETDVQEPLGDLHDAAGSVAESVETITQLTTDQSQGVRAAAEETEDLSATVEEIAGTAGNVRTLGERTEEIANEGVTEAEETVGAMEDLQDETQAAVEATERLEQQADRIDEVVETIEEVTNQTKILAANARVEASRSDASSEALDVLGEEVRSFAEDTSEQLATLPETVEELRAIAREVSDAIDDTASQLEDSSGRVESLGERLETVHEAADETADGMAEIERATDRQARSAEAIAAEMDGLADAADRVAGETESLAASAEEQTAALGDVAESVERLTDTSETLSTAEGRRPAR